MNFRKPGQVSLWYEIHEKYELDLVKLDPYSDDDEDMLKQSDKWEPEESAPKKPKKSKFKCSITHFNTLYREKQERQER